MRDYAKIIPRFWTGDTGRKLRGHPNQQVIMMYLLTCPSSNMLGLYYLPLPVVCHETGISEPEVRGALNWLSKEDVAHYDHQQELVWVPQMALYQVGRELRPGDKNILGIKKDLIAYRGHPFAVDFIRRYNDAFSLGIDDTPEALLVAAGGRKEGASKGLRRAFEGPSKGGAMTPEAPSKPGSGTGAGSGTGEREATLPPSYPLSDRTGDSERPLVPVQKPIRWPASKWLAKFSAAWCAKYGGTSYGGGSATAKATAELSDVIGGLTDAEALAAEARADAMIAEFLAGERPNEVRARHPWPFFVAAFIGLRAPMQRPQARASPAGAPAPKYDEF